MMVRKVGEGPVLPGEDAPDLRRSRRKIGPPEEFDVDPPIGQAAEGEHLLVGKEVDEATVRTQQVVEQVRELVGEDPTSSVSILQRWIDAQE
jgi:hypothetical protein